MNALYVDCSSGITARMLLGALLHLGVPPAHIEAELEKLGLPGAKVEAHSETVCCIRATSSRVVPAADSAEKGPKMRLDGRLATIISTIEQSRLPAETRAMAAGVFKVLGMAEATVHGEAIEALRVFEIGSLASVAEVVACCAAIRFLHVSKVYCGAVALGSGFADVAHGRVPLPFPAVVQVLEAMPVQLLNVQGPLTSPQGAAILKAIVDEPGVAPSLRVRKVGYGVGRSAGGASPRLLRLILGEPLDPGKTQHAPGTSAHQISAD